MRVLITGADGQLGCELQRALREHELVPAIWPAFDLMKPESEAFIRDARAQVVIHAAAYTDVDGAERDAEEAMSINAIGTERVAKGAAGAGSRLIVISTDYVFDGRKHTPYLETDEPNPQSVYGRSKLEGERRALRYCPGTLIVRTAWLYGAQGKNFVKTIMRLASEQPELRVVADQRGCPTHAGDLAEALGKLLDIDLAGIAHATGSGECTWHEFACAIVDELGLTVPVKAITTAEARRAAPRPACAILKNTRLAAEGVVLPSWRDALRRFIRDVRSPSSIGAT
jgi:dTDP-4-dehydrorhamnose reductase